MWNTTVTLYRPEGHPFIGLDGRPAANIAVQVDMMNMNEIIQHKQITNFHGFFLYKIFMNWNPCAIVKQEDILIDDQIVDPDSPTGANYKYRVTSRPKNYLLDHQEFLVEVVPGT